MKIPDNLCCGSYSPQKKLNKKEFIPSNPKIKGGVALIYVGAGKKKFKGMATGFVYHVSDHSRHFNVHTEDADALLNDPAIIRKP